MYHRLRTLAFAAFLLAHVQTAASAALTGFLSGTVTQDGAARAGVAVTIAGNNTVQHARTDATGRFSLAVTLGSYDVTAAAGDRHASVRAEVGSNGTTVALVLETGLKKIGNVSVVRSSALRGSGSDTTFDADFLSRSPASGSLPELLVQLPGAARGANGVVHLNGDHGDIDYIVDGVPIPQELNRNIGTEFDPNDVAFADVVEGAYPAQYGERFGGVINITSRSGTGPASFEGDVRTGSYGWADATLGYHAPLGNGGGLAVSIRNQRGTRGLDPPNFDSPHDDFSEANQLLHATLPLGPNDFFNATLTHNYATFEIPNDVANGQPATSNDNETQEDTFVNFQFRHALGEGGLVTFGPAVKVSRIRDFGDAPNDFRFGEALELAGGGSPTGCATALLTGAFGPATCAYSLHGDRTAADYRFQTDYVQRSRAHDVRVGFAYDFSDVGKLYAVTLQPGNFLARAYTPATPDAPYTVADKNSNSGDTFEAYVQDGWRLGTTFALDYGLRYDHFSISSVSFSRDFTQFSPRLKITRFLGPRASAYAYVGRFFTPFSFENVDPRAAQLLNLPEERTVAQYDLRPERDTMMEIGAHLQLGPGNLGLRLWQKNATDLIDDTQVGVTLLHQDINYRVGRLSSESAFYELPLARDGRFYASVAHTLSLNAGCETQLLAPCFGSPSGFTPADHDQSYDVTSGILANDSHGGWFALDGEYGSGLSSASCPPGTPGFCKRTPHLTFDAERGIGLGARIALTFRVRNILNDRYYVTLLNAQGNHYASPREFDAGVRFGR